VIRPVEKGLNTVAKIENQIMDYLQAAAGGRTRAELDRDTRLTRRFGIFLVNRALDILAEEGEINQIRGVYSIAVYG
jgi:hypothetical protein